MLFLPREGVLGDESPDYSEGIGKWFIRNHQPDYIANLLLIIHYQYTWVDFFRVELKDGKVAGPAKNSESNLSETSGDTDQQRQHQHSFLDTCDGIFKDGLLPADESHYVLDTSIEEEPRLIVDNGDGLACMIKANKERVGRKTKESVKCLEQLLDNVRELGKYSQN